MPDYRFLPREAKHSNSTSLLRLRMAPVLHQTRSLRLEDWVGNWVTSFPEPWMLSTRSVPSRSIIGSTSRVRAHSETLMGLFGVSQPNYLRRLDCTVDFAVAVSSSNSVQPKTRRHRLAGPGGEEGESKDDILADHWF